MNGGFGALLRHRLLRHSAVYAGAGVARNAIPFLLIPILTRYLSPAEVGTVATFEVMLAMGLVFVGLNMHGAIGVNFFKFERSELDVYVGNVILISMGSAIATMAVALIVLPLVPLDLPESPVRWIPLLVLAALAQALFSVALTLWQVEQRPIPYALFQVLQTAMNVGLSLLFVVALGWGWRGRLLGIVIASIAFGVLSLAVVYRRGVRRLSYRTEHIRDALAFGVPLVPHSLGNWILTGIDRLFLASMVGVAATGVYTIGYQVGMVVGLIATSFNQAWSPFLYQKLEQNDPATRVRLVKFNYAFMVAIALAALVFSAIAPWFLSVFVGPEFRGAQAYVFWIAMGYAGYGMYLMVAHYVFYAKKTHLLAVVTFVSALLNVLLNYLLIPAQGPIGAAQASTASFFVSFILTWILAARVYKMPWRVWAAQPAVSGAAGG